MADASSLMIMHAVFLSENPSLNEKPILVKNSLAFARSWTGKLTKVPMAIVVSFLAVGLAATRSQLVHG
jgi:hypothetical protein